MLLSPSRADCIIFSLDNVIVDSSVAFAKTATLCLTRSWSGESVEAGALDLVPYYKIALKRGVAPSCGDLAWALLSLAAASGRADLCDALPTLDAWQDEMDKACREGFERFAADSADRRRVYALCDEIYHGVDARGAKTAGEGTRTLEKPLYHSRWDKLPLPVAVCARRSRSSAQAALAALGWNDLPRERVVTADGGKAPDAAALESLCRTLGGRWPLFLGGCDADRILMDSFGRGDFITVGSQLSSNIIRFTSAADALRAILGVF